jgi:hypothetical protein
MENEPREGCASLIKKRQKASTTETKITQTLNSHFKA